MLSGSFSIFKWPGSPVGPNEFLEIIVERVILVSCQNIVTLSATVIGDLSAHTFLWIQTGGPVVNWLEPQNQLMVMYEKNPSQSGQDCFFRFYVDKGTPFEQFRDLVVSGTARDDVFSSNHYASLGTIGTQTINFSVYPALSYSPDYSINDSNLLFTFTIPQWQPPALPTKNVIYTVDNGVYTQVLELTPQGTMVFNTDTSKNYVVRLFYTIPGLPYEYYYESGILNLQYALVDRPLTFDTSDVVINMGALNNAGNVTYFQTNILTLSTELGEDTVTNFISTYQNLLGYTNIFQTQILTLLALPETPEESVTQINTNYGVPGRTSVFQVQISDGITVIG